MATRLLARALWFILLAPMGGLEERPRIAVIVHPARQAAMSVEDLAQVYLRRKRFWDDGTPIVPLNLAAGTALRDAFSRAVLRQNGARLADYWNRQYFHGILPPATLASTTAILRYVASEPNAVGYVPAAEADTSVHVILHLE